MEDTNRRTVCQRVLCGLVAVVAAVGGSLVAASPGAAHSGDSIDATWSATGPIVDGAMTAGEWAGAASVDLGAIPGNQLPSFLLVTNNDTYLWLAYDAVGDRTESGSDAASFALDTGHDGVGTDGGEDEFYVANFTAHLVWRGGAHTIEDAPFNTGLPDHAGLAGVRGFGPSDASATSHRFYEFQIPLVLIGASAADTVGFFGGSDPAPGVLDAAGFVYSTWPDYVTGPIAINQYGNLNLAYLPGPIGVLLSPSTTGANGAPGETVWYNLTARNIGTAVSDTIDITASGAWSASLWDATGTAPLADTDGDTVPDTGNLTSGSSAAFVVKVDIPPSATGCDVAGVTARSSWDVSILDTSALTTCLGPALFSPPHSDRGVDLDGNGRFDYLDVDVSIAVTTSGTYEVDATLYDQSGTTFIMSQATTFFGTPGPNTVTFSFLGRTIYDSGIDGPYRVDLYLFQLAGPLIDTDTHLTRAYLATDFEAPAAAFRPPHSDRGVDTDVPPNGRYDQLQLDIGVTVNTAGTYYIETAVMDSGFNFVTFQAGTFPFATGSQTATFLYPGELFYAATSDGPYRIQMVLYDLSRNMLDMDTYTTGPYAKTDFDPPPIAFAPPHSDHGEDTDVPPDGLFDWLVVSASLDVAEAGDFTLSGSLYGPGGFPFIADATAQATLGVGAATMDLKFPGVAIRQAFRSGFFQVYMDVARTGSNASTDYDSYMTGFYDFTDFQPPPAQFERPHGDRGVDASSPPDGLYDWLVIDAGVNVTKAGRFTVDGMLWGSRGFLAPASATLDVPTPGRVTVPLYFDGHLLRRDLGGGPYSVDLRLYDANLIQLDYDTYFTRPYANTEFQTPDGSRPVSAASVGGGYWKNGPFAVPYTATDPSPSDGLLSVQLQYRHSTDNATWSSWSAYDEDVFPSVGDASVTGSFAFGLPDGDAYYQFRTVATDRAGNTEALPATPDASVSAFVPARLDLTPSTATVATGVIQAFQLRVLTAGGVPAPLESALTVMLIRDSAGGEFRATGTSTAITSVTIPAGASEASFDYADSLPGTSTVTVASARTVPDSAMLMITGTGPGGGGGASSNLAIGLGGGLAIGIAAGIAVGWLVGRRRRAQGGAPPSSTSPPPAAPPPPAQPPGGSP